MRKALVAILCGVMLLAVLVSQEAVAANATLEPDRGESAGVGDSSTNQVAGANEAPGARDDPGDPDDGPPDAAEVLSEPVPDATPVAAEVQTVPVTSTEDGVATMASQVDGLRVVGVTWDDDGEAVQVRLRSHDGHTWSLWEDVDVEAPEDGDVAGRPGTEPVVLLDAEQVEVEVQSSSDAVQATAELTVIDPGSSEADTTLAGTAPATRMAPMAAPQIPRIRSRADWGADETQRFWRPRPGRVTGAVVHHTAGTNNYTREQVPGLIRGIYHYHANTRGWGTSGTTCWWTASAGPGRGGTAGWRMPWSGRTPPGPTRPCSVSR